MAPLKPSKWTLGLLLGMVANLAPTGARLASAQSSLLPFGVDLELGVEVASVFFDPLAEFTRFDSSPADRREDRVYEYRSRGAGGFRAGVALHRDLEIGWSRLWAQTKYRVFVNGENIADGIRDGLPVQMGEVDLRFDLLSVRYRPSQLEWHRVRPVLGLGYGWILQSQQTRFQPPDNLAVDYSDSDGSWEATLGVEGCYRWLKGGMQLRSVHWRFDTEDERIPATMTHAWMLGAWLGIAL